MARRAHGRRTAVALTAAALALWAVPLVSEAAERHLAGTERDYAFSLYGGRQTDDNWRDSITGQADLVDAQVLVAALGWTFDRSAARAASWELEGNVAKHFGDQQHWEFNLLVNARWHRFPWNHRVATTMAFGMGPSYATAIPRVEVRNDGASERLLLFWQFEVTAAPPQADWTAMFRLHHRSTGYGLFGGAGGGNALTAGVRWYF